jgi:hypothetical protein
MKLGQPRESDSVCHPFTGQVIGREVPAQPKLADAGGTKLFAGSGDGTMCYSEVLEREATSIGGLVLIAECS